MNCRHEWDISPQEAISLQKSLAQDVRLQPLPEHIEILGAADIGYVPSVERLAAAVLTFRWPDLTILERVHVIAPILFPYIPGLLSFREVPPLLEAFQQLRRPPDVLLCDGQGIAHPRKLGLASHLGLCLNLPTVGCAKKLLCGRHDPLDLHRGNYVPLRYRKETVGFVFCSRDGVKPIYISPGHLADFDTSLELVRQCLGRFRIPTPLRHAHNLATELRQKLAASG
ncbi:MAG: endonuclease V [Syntrophobacteraceae bacterium]|nr:endonuclease V [Desulfobacteraceae bacterium]